MQQDQRTNLKSSYIVCALPRSGSTLLCEGLAQTRQTGIPKEYFHQPLREQFQAQWQLSDASFSTYFEEVLKQATTSNGVFGFKIMYPDLPPLIDQLRQSARTPNLPAINVLQQFFPDLQLIFIHRRDHIRQAISLVRARQTGIWQHHPEQSQTQQDVELSYDSAVIDQAILEITRWEGAWRLFFEQIDSHPWTIVYEDFIRNYPNTIQATLNFLGQPHLQDIPTPRLEKIADQTTEDWFYRYIGEHNAFLIPGRQLPSSK
jgi:LPS sulfotransferase NodH